MDNIIIKSTNAKIQEIIKFIKSIDSEETFRFINMLVGHELVPSDIETDVIYFYKSKNLWNWVDDDFDYLKSKFSFQEIQKIKIVDFDQLIREKKMKNILDK